MARRAGDHHAGDNLQRFDVIRAPAPSRRAGQSPRAAAHLRGRVRLAILQSIGNTLLFVAPVALVAYLLVNGTMQLPQAMAAATGVMLLRPLLQGVFWSATQLYECVALRRNIAVLFQDFCKYLLDVTENIGIDSLPEGYQTLFASLCHRAPRRTVRRALHAPGVSVSGACR